MKKKYFEKDNRRIVVEAFRVGYDETPEWYYEYIKMTKGMHVSIMPTFGKWVVKYENNKIKVLYNDVFEENYEIEKPS